MEDRKALIMRIVEYVHGHGGDCAILAAKEKATPGQYIVLAAFGTQFVTWEFQFDRGFYWGHYCGFDFEDGMNDFINRV